MRNGIRTTWRAVAATSALALILAIASGVAQAQSAAPAGPRTVLDGVYTDAQADRGDAAYAGACAACHEQGADGGAGENIERRFGRFGTNGRFDPLAELGGTLRQLFSVGSFNNPALPASSRGLCQSGNPTLCCVPVERSVPTMSKL